MGSVDGLAVCAGRAAATPRTRRRSLLLLAGVAVSAAAGFVGSMFTFPRTPDPGGTEATAAPSAAPPTAAAAPPSAEAAR